MQPRIKPTQAALPLLAHCQNRAGGVQRKHVDALAKMYRFYLRRDDLPQALDLVYQSLIQAAVEGGFSADWAEPQPDCVDWRQASGPARRFLDALHTLAAIRQRQGDLREVRRVRQVLQKLDANFHQNPAMNDELIGRWLKGACDA